MGYGFDHEVRPRHPNSITRSRPPLEIQWEVFTGSKNDPENPHQVASVCYGAAIFYAALFAFCGCQIGVHNRVAKGGNIRLS
ncbi:hypothetical protein CPB86DRAFT_716585 [Serendipita vermifera]|nr:hypothetical protein CPB86DRAFT_716585 [Serendipita vermifera]